MLYMNEPAVNVICFLSMIIIKMETIMNIVNELKIQFFLILMDILKGFLMSILTGGFDEHFKRFFLKGSLDEHY